MSHQPPYPHGIIPPEGTNAPLPVRAQAHGQQAQDKPPPLKSRSALLAALGLPDLPGLPSHEVLLSAIIGQRVQDRVLWLLVLAIAAYFFGHGLFGWGPCPDATTLATIRELVPDLEQRAQAEDATGRTK
jgi:hypothetical protein